MAPQPIFILQTQTGAILMCVRVVLFSILFACSHCDAFMRFEGFVPPGISPASATFEYRRIYNALSTDSTVDTTALTVTFFFKKGFPAHRYSLPEWGGGGAVGADKIVVALDPEPFFYTDFFQITTHELVHIAISRLCPYLIPRWFHEGAAMLLSGEAGFAEQSVLSRAILSGSLLSLSSIDSVNSFSHFKAQLAYAQSHQAILFLVDTYGIEVLKEILANTAETGSFAEGLRETLQISQNEIEAMTRARLIRRFRLLFFVADTYLFWVLGAFLFIAAYMVTKKRNRRKAELMEIQEQTVLADLKNGSDDESAPPS
jgi:hypothetical protein